MHHLNISAIASMSHHGTTPIKCSFILSALENPTSPKVAKAFRFSDDKDMWSKSIIRMRWIPDLTSMLTAWLPTPPRPITTTKAFCINKKFSSPKKFLTLEYISSYLIVITWVTCSVSFERLSKIWTCDYLYFSRNLRGWIRTIIFSWYIIIKNILFS